MKKLLLITVILSFILTSCGANTSVAPTNTNSPITKEENSPTEENTASREISVSEQNTEEKLQKCLSLAKDVATA
jgi:peptidoglycan hydrolase CwlO-like protein